MAITRTNRDLVMIDGYGNLYIIYPSTNAKAVIVDPSINETVFSSDMTTLEKVLESLGKLGLKSTVELSDMDDNLFAIGDGSKEDEERLAKQKSITKINISIDNLKQVIEGLPTMENIIEITNRIQKLEATQPVLKSTGEGFSTICEWQDGNPTSQNRLYKFVTYASSNDSKLVKIASRSGSTGDIICGISMPANGIISNMKDKYLLDDGSLIRSAVAVTTVGPAYVLDGGICSPGDFCICNENGTASKSENGVGYYVISRVDGETILINFTPGVEFILSMEAKVSEINDRMSEIQKAWSEYPEITSGTSDPTGGKEGDVYIKYDA